MKLNIETVQRAFFCNPSNFDFLLLDIVKEYIITPKKYINIQIQQVICTWLHALHFISLTFFYKKKKTFSSFIVGLVIYKTTLTVVGIGSSTLQLMSLQKQPLDGIWGRQVSLFTSSLTGGTYKQVEPSIIHRYNDVKLSARLIKGNPKRR